MDLFEVQATFDPQKLTQKLPVEVIGIHPNAPPAVSLMMRARLQERFGLRFHVEERSINVTAVLLANADGQLGPNLRPSRSECPEASKMFAMCGIPLREGPPDFYEAVGVPFSRFVGILRSTEVFTSTASVNLRPTEFRWRQCTPRHPPLMTLAVCFIKPGLLPVSPQ